MKQLLTTTLIKPIKSLKSFGGGGGAGPSKSELVPLKSLLVQAQGYIVFKGKNPKDHNLHQSHIRVRGTLKNSFLAGHSNHFRHNMSITFHLYFFKLFQIFFIILVNTSGSLSRPWISQMCCQSSHNPWGGEQRAENCLTSTTWSQNKMRLPRAFHQNL